MYMIVEFIFQMGFFIAYTIPAFSQFYTGISQLLTSLRLTMFVMFLFKIRDAVHISTSSSSHSSSSSDSKTLFTNPTVGILNADNADPKDSKDASSPILRSSSPFRHVHRTVSNETAIMQVDSSVVDGSTWGASYSYSPPRAGQLVGTVAPPSGGGLVLSSSYRSQRRS